MFRRLILAPAALLLVAIGLAGTALAQTGTARLQIIHNAADPAAASVDVWVNGARLLDDFAFRAATEFLTVPAGVVLNVGVAPGDSDSADDALATFPLTLAAGKRYVAIANGVLGSGFEPNPDGRSIAFDVFAQDGAALTGAFGFVRLRAFHGATDAPTVDIVARGGWAANPLFDDLAYGQFSAERWLPARKYTLDVTPGGDNGTVVASFEADLTGLRNGAAVVFASGFLSPGENAGGPAFGLFAALPSGAVVALPPVMTTARLQVIHNSADPAAAAVDLYVNGQLFADDFAFRAATEFRTVPAGTVLNIGVAPGNSSGPGDAIATIPVTLAAGRTYVAIANGVLDPSAFAVNPQGRPIGFQLFAKDGIRERSWTSSSVKLIAFHGATDAPVVDVRATGGFLQNAVLAGDLGYGDYSAYRTVAPVSYTLDVTPAGQPGTVVASFHADLSGLGGGAAVVFASGFLNPAANAGGPAFGLFAALPTGQVVALPPRLSTAQLQIIHNSADPAAATVDVWVNGDRLLDDFAFRTATPFVDVPAGVALNVGVAPGNSDDAGDALATFTVTLAADRKYVAVASGVLAPGAFAPNPDGRGTGFTLLLREGARTESRFGFVNLLAVHGATDAPTVDVVMRTVYGGKRVLFDNLAYGDLQGYRVALPIKTVLSVTPGNDNSTVVASFTADLTGLRNSAAVVFASGFLNPGANGNGPAFGLFAALPNGQVVALPPVGGAAVLAESADKAATPAASFKLEQNAPNPFNPATTISFSLPKAADVSLRVFNVRGELVKALVEGPREAGQHTVDFRADNVPSGVYFYRLDAGEYTETRKMMLLK